LNYIFPRDSISQEKISCVRLLRITDSVASWHIFMPNFWNLAFFGGGWHKYFWFGVFVKFGIFFSNQFFWYVENIELKYFRNFQHFCLRKHLWNFSLHPLFCSCTSFLQKMCFRGYKTQLKNETNVWYFKDLKFIKEC